MDAVLPALGAGLSIRVFAGVEAAQVESVLTSLLCHFAQGAFCLGCSRDVENLKEAFRKVDDIIR